MKSFKQPLVVKIGNIEIDIEKFHILKMLEATKTCVLGGHIFITDAKFTAALLNEGLCVPYPEKKDAVVGTDKLVDIIPSVENYFHGDNND